MRVLIIDDEAPARNILKTYLNEYSEYEIVGECENGFEGLKSIKELKPDLIFLDIQMPKLDGFELLELIEDRPEIVFVTAFDQYAIKAFDQNAVDYLLKPYSPDRLKSTIAKIDQRMSSKEEEEPDEKINNVLDAIHEKKEILERVVVKNGAKIEIFPVKDILYIKAEDDYVMIYTVKGRFLKKATMKYFEGHLPPDQYVRVHRSYIVNTVHIQRMERYGKETMIIRLPGNVDIKTSKAGAKRMKEVLGL